MPITPKFRLSQTDSHICVEVQVPHIRVSNESLEVVIEDSSILHFYSSPYLLVLHFNGVFDDNADEGCATYDPSNSRVNLQLPKKYANETWPDLDLVGTMVRERKSQTTCWLRSVEGEDEEEIESNDREDAHVSRSGYGFLQQYTDVFTDLAREGLAKEMLELPDPCICPLERRKLRLQVEQEKFDEDRYLGDMEIEDDYIYQSAMTMDPHWGETTPATNADDQFFTQDETLQLATIPYPLLPSKITDEEEKSLLLGLLDILFAYVYDHLMTGGEATVESSWTISTLSSTLSWLEVPSGDLHESIGHSIRRALIYPYLRNYDLAVHCWKQVAVISKSRRVIIRCLLQTRATLESEFHYLGNKLYLDHYLAWIQRRVSQQVLSSVAEEIEEVLQKNLKERLGLNLVALERLVYESESEEDESESDESDSSDSGSSTDQNSEGVDSSCQDETSNDGLNEICESLEQAHLAATSKELLDSNLQDNSFLDLSIGGEQTLPRRTKPLIQEVE